MANKLSIKILIVILLLNFSHQNLGLNSQNEQLKKPGAIYSPERESYIKPGSKYDPESSKRNLSPNLVELENNLTQSFEPINLPQNANQGNNSQSTSMQGNSSQSTIQNENESSKPSKTVENKNESPISSQDKNGLANTHEIKITDSDKAGSPKISKEIEVSAKPRLDTNSKIVEGNNASSQPSNEVKVGLAKLSKENDNVTSSIPTQNNNDKQAKPTQPDDKKDKSTQADDKQAKPTQPDGKKDKPTTQPDDKQAKPTQPDDKKDKPTQTQSTGNTNSQTQSTGSAKPIENINEQSKQTGNNNGQAIPPIFKSDQTLLNVNNKSNSDNSTSRDIDSIIITTLISEIHKLSIKSGDLKKIFTENNNSLNTLYDTNNLENKIIDAFFQKNFFFSIYNPFFEKATSRLLKFEETFHKYSTNKEFKLGKLKDIKNTQPSSNKEFIDRIPNFKEFFLFSTNLLLDAEKYILDYIFSKKNQVEIQLVLNVNEKINTQFGRFLVKIQTLITELDKIFDILNKATKIILGPRYLAEISELFKLLDPIEFKFSGNFEITINGFEDPKNDFNSISYFSTSLIIPEKRGLKLPLTYEFTINKRN